MKTLSQIFKESLIKEATFEADKLYRKKAANFVMKFVDKIILGDNNTLNLEIFKKYAQPIKHSFYKGSYMVPAYAVDPEFKDLFIVFAPERLKGQTAATANAWVDPMPAKDKIIFFLVFPGLKKDFDIQSLNKYQGFRDDVFVHEMIHYLDFKRWSNGSEAFFDHIKEREAEMAIANSVGHEKDLQRLKQRQDRTAINSPLEFNAYFQQFVLVMQSSIKEANAGQTKRFKNMFKKTFPNNPNDFLVHVKESFSSFFNKLNDKYKRKFEKRVALYFKPFRQMVDKL